MKKIAICLMMLFCMMGFSACGAKDAAEEVEISYTMTFINETGHDITSLQLRPTADYDWTENMLSEDVWQDGYEVPVSLSGKVPVTESGWEVKVTFAEGAEHTWENITMEDGAEITFALDEEDSSETEEPVGGETEESTDVVSEETQAE